MASISSTSATMKQGDHTDATGHIDGLSKGQVYTLDHQQFTPLVPPEQGTIPLPSLNLSRAPAGRYTESHDNGFTRLSTAPATGVDDDEDSQWLADIRARQLRIKDRLASTALQQRLMSEEGWGIAASGSSIHRIASTRIQSSISRPYGPGSSTGPSSGPRSNASVRGPGSRTRPDAPHPSPSIITHHSGHTHHSPTKSQRAATTAPLATPYPYSAWAPNETHPTWPHPHAHPGQELAPTHKPPHVSVKSRAVSFMLLPHQHQLDKAHASMSSQRPSGPVDGPGGHVDGPGGHVALRVKSSRGAQSMKRTRNVHPQGSADSPPRISTANYRRLAQSTGGLVVDMPTQLESHHIIGGSHVITTHEGHSSSPRAVAPHQAPQLHLTLLYSPGNNATSPAMHPAHTLSDTCVSPSSSTGQSATPVEWQGSGSTDEHHHHHHSHNHSNSASSPFLQLSQQGLVSEEGSPVSKVSTTDVQGVQGLQAAVQGFSIDPPAPSDSLSTFQPPDLPSADPPHSTPPSPFISMPSHLLTPLPLPSNLHSPDVLPPTHSTQSSPEAIHTTFSPTFSPTRHVFSPTSASPSTSMSGSPSRRTSTATMHRLATRSIALGNQVQLLPRAPSSSRVSMRHGPLPSGATRISMGSPEHLIQQHKSFIQHMTRGNSIAVLGGRNSMKRSNSRPNVKPGFKLAIDPEVEIGQWTSQGIFVSEENVESDGVCVPPGLQVIDPDDLIRAYELGRGQFGSVWLFLWCGVEVAVKELNEACGMTGAQQQEVFHEAECLASLRHPCVIAFYGIVTSSPDCYATVVEYCRGGNLKSGLKRLRDQGVVPASVKAAVALQAARGMEYLHSRGVVHFDLKCENLLCDLKDVKRPVVKIGDLGLSKLKHGNSVKGMMLGTLPWMAPELFPGGAASLKVARSQGRKTMGEASTGAVQGDVGLTGMEELSPVGGMSGAGHDCEEVPPWEQSPQGLGRAHGGGQERLPWEDSPRGDVGGRGLEREGEGRLPWEDSPRVVASRGGRASTMGGQGNGSGGGEGGTDALDSGQWEEVVVDGYSGNEGGGYDDEDDDLLDDGLVTEKVDLYSFGVVLWEIWTLGERPYDGLAVHDLNVGIMDGTLRPEIPKDCDDKWIQLMQDCWAGDPRDRPTFSQVSGRLQALVQQYSDAEALTTAVACTADATALTSPGAAGRAHVLPSSAVSSPLQATTSVRPHADPETEALLCQDEEIADALAKAQAEETARDHAHRVPWALGPSGDSCVSVGGEGVGRLGGGSGRLKSFRPLAHSLRLGMQLTRAQSSRTSRHEQDPNTVADKHVNPVRISWSGNESSSKPPRHSTGHQLANHLVNLHALTQDTPLPDSTPILGPAVGSHSHLPTWPSTGSSSAGGAVPVLKLALPCLQLPVHQGPQSALSPIPSTPPDWSETSTPAWPKHSLSRFQMSSDVGHDQQPSIRDGSMANGTAEHAAAPEHGTHSRTQSGSRE